MINNFVQRSEILFDRNNNDFLGLFKTCPVRDNIIREIPLSRR